jgi:hypothetical protein
LKKKKSKSSKYIHVGGLNLKGGLGKLTNPKRKEKQVYLLSHKEQKRRRRGRGGRSSGSNHGHHISL